MAKKLKNANGEGSVYKLSGNRRKPWVCAFVVGYNDDTAKPIVTTKTFLSYDEAEYYRQTSVMVKKGLITNPGIQFGIDTTERIKPPSFKTIYNDVKVMQFDKHPSTKRPYEAAFKKLQPIHDMPIDSIRYEELNSIFEKYSHKVSASSLNNMKVVACLVFEDALKKDMITKNYAQLIEFTPVIKEKRNTEVFSSIELGEIVNISNENETARVIKILCYTGLRISEFFNIESENVFIDERYFIAGSKTKAGKDRVIPIHKDIIEDILYFYNDNEKLLYSRYTEFISRYAKFKNEYSTLMNDLNFTERAMNIHDTRKTFVSIIDRQCTDINMLKRIVGHTFQDITNQVYIKKTPSDFVEFIDSIDFHSYYLLATR